MENKIPAEHELEKNVDSDAETASAANSEPRAQADQAAPVEPLKKLQDELAEAKDKYVRLYAEFENHRRRTAKEKLEMVMGANEQLLKALLPIYDDFERASRSFKESDIKAAEGFTLIQNKFIKVLELYGVKTMETAVGSAFDSDLHEAISQAPVEDEKLVGKIIDVVEKGFLLNDKVIRFAKVIIGSSPATKS